MLGHQVSAARRLSRCRCRQIRLAKISDTRRVLFFGQRSCSSSSSSRTDGGKCQHRTFQVRDDPENIEQKATRLGLHFPEPISTLLRKPEPAHRDVRPCRQVPHNGVQKNAAAIAAYMVSEKGHSKKTTTPGKDNIGKGCVSLFQTCQFGRAHALSLNCFVVTHPVFRLTFPGSVPLGQLHSTGGGLVAARYVPMTAKTAII